MKETSKMMLSQVRVKRARLLKKVLKFMKGISRTESDTDKVFIRLMTEANILGPLPKVFMMEKESLFGLMVKPIKANG